MVLFISRFFSNFESSILLLSSLINTTTGIFSLKSFIIFSEFNAIKVNEEIKNKTIDILIITRK